MLSADSYDKEKPEEILVEEVPEGSSGRTKDGLTDTTASDYTNRLSMSEERSLVRKIDTWLLPTVFLIWIMNYIDVSTPC